MRGRYLSGLVLSLVFSLLCVPAVAGKSVAVQESAPAAGVLLDLDFPGEVGWYYQNDVGILLAYADGRLHRTDLLAGTPEVLPAVEVPDLSAKRSVVPIARTGLLLVPNSTSGGSTGSLAIDTVGGRVLWKGDPLPAPDFVVSYPDAGLAVMRSFDDNGHVFALDLRTGKKIWDVAMRATIIWAEGSHVRFVSGADLLTLDVGTGKTVRTDKLEIPKETRLYALKDEGVIIFWKNKFLEGRSLPPMPPAAAAPCEHLWDFKAAGMMVNMCIKGGGCDINRVGDDMLMVDSAGHHELVRITTGERLLHVKQGMFPVPVRVSPNGRFVAAATGERLIIYDAPSGRLLHEVEYPKGGEGMKSLRYLRWLGDDEVIVVFPDKKGNPKKMSAFSCRQGTLMWSFVLPEVADYALTAEQRAKLIGRITLSLLATAVSASNPMTVGGTGYYAIFVPDLNVAESLDAGGAMGRGAVGDESARGPAFGEAKQRYDRCEALGAEKAGLLYFVTGNPGDYKILQIDLNTGDVETRARHAHRGVHQIAPLTAFGVGVTLENNNRKLQLISLEGKGGAKPASAESP